MKFTHFNSLVNHYNDRSLRWWLTWNPGLAHARFVATEKLHGSNFSVWIDTDGTVRYAKRTKFLSPDENFYGYQEVIAKQKFQTWLDDAKALVSKRGSGLAFFGEIFGPGVQKHINYGTEKDIRFYTIFDIATEKYLPAYEFYDVVPADMRVPHVTLVDGLDAALALDDAFPTMINPIEGNICEGIVIVPWNGEQAAESGERFMIKKKNPKFREDTGADPAPKVREVSQEVLAVTQRAMPYVCQNRLLNVISHEGEPEMTQFSQYLKLFVADVSKDLLEDHPDLDAGLTDKQKKEAWKAIGSQCAVMLKNYIINGGFTA